MGPISSVQWDDRCYIQVTLQERISKKVMLKLASALTLKCGSSRPTTIALSSVNLSTSRIRK